MRMEHKKRADITRKKESPGETVSSRWKVKKTGEIFYTDCGKFLFVCSHCNTTWRTGNSIVKHMMDAHYAHTLASPEFVSINDLKREMQHNATAAVDGKNIGKDRSERKARPEWKDRSERLKAAGKRAMMANIVKRRELKERMEVDRLERMKFEDKIGRVNTPMTSSEKTCSDIVAKEIESTDRIEVAGTVKTEVVSSSTTNEPGNQPDVSQKRKIEDDGPESSPAAKLVKIVKLKRIKPFPGLKAMNKKILNEADVTNCKPIATNIEQSPKVPVLKQVTLTKNKPMQTRLCGNVMKPVFDKPIDSTDPHSCYQCKMEPEVIDPSQARRHVCAFCKMWFPNHDRFKAHTWNIHKKDPAFVVCQEFHCYKCRTMFPSQHYLTVHMATHQEKDKEMHLCPICGNIHKTRYRLELHMQVHEDIDEDDKFKCDDCGKKFRRLNALQQHFKLHVADRSFVCTVCAKGFKTKMYLQNHMAVHEEPKIQCRYCDAKFHFPQVRRAHEKTRHLVM